MWEPSSLFWVTLHIRFLSSHALTLHLILEDEQDVKGGVG